MKKEINAACINSLTARAVTASYGSKIILNDISASLTAGDFTCLCGPNGAGKTTLLNVMAGLADAHLKVSGGVFLEGQKGSGVSEGLETLDVSALPRRTGARLIAFMQQNEFSEWNFMVKDFVLQGRYSHSNGGHSIGLPVPTEIVTSFPAASFRRFALPGPLLRLRDSFCWTSRPPIWTMFLNPISCSCFAIPLIIKTLEFLRQFTI